jgi:hypothetical protein
MSVRTEGSSSGINRSISRDSVQKRHVSAEHAAALVLFNKFLVQPTVRQRAVKAFKVLI